MIGSIWAMLLFCQLARRRIWGFGSVFEFICLCRRFRSEKTRRLWGFRPFRIFYRASNCFIRQGYLFLWVDFEFRLRIWNICSRAGSLLFSFWLHFLAILSTTSLFLTCTFHNLQVFWWSPSYKMCRIISHFIVWWPFISANEYLLRAFPWLILLFISFNVIFFTAELHLEPFFQGYLWSFWTGLQVVRYQFYVF